MTDDDLAEILALEVPCDASAPSVVRDALGRLDGLGWIIGDATLVASELVANAVMHSGGRPEHVLQVRAFCGDDVLRISVQDPGISGQDAHPRPTDVLSNGGWGLMIIEQLAVRWGAEREDGYRVWADVALPPGSGDAGDPCTSAHGEP